MVKMAGNPMGSTSKKLTCWIQQDVGYNSTCWIQLFPGKHIIGKIYAEKVNYP